MITPARKFLILGGARSGKTRYAMALAEQHPRRTYIATAEGHDEEMRHRISNHKAERGANWATIEEPLQLSKAIAVQQNDDTVVMVDCLTLWLANLFGAERDIETETHEFLTVVRKSTNRLILVSNEVGLGIVPENALARKFRDAQGFLNQRVAKIVDHVDFVAAGIPLNLKPGS